MGKNRKCPYLVSVRSFKKCKNIQCVWFNKRKGGYKPLALNTGSTLINDVDNNARVKKFILDNRSTMPIKQRNYRNKYRGKYKEKPTTKAKLPYANPIVRRHWKVWMLEVKNWYNKRWLLKNIGYYKSKNFYHSRYNPLYAGKYDIKYPVVSDDNKPHNVTTNQIYNNDPTPVKPVTTNLTPYVRSNTKSHLPLNYKIQSTNPTATVNTTISITHKANKIKIQNLTAKVEPIIVTSKDKVQNPSVNVKMYDTKRVKKSKIKPLSRTEIKIISSTKTSEFDKDKTQRLGPKNKAHKTSTKDLTFTNNKNKIQKPVIKAVASSYKTKVTTPKENFKSTSVSPLSKDTSSNVKTINSRAKNKFKENSKGDRVVNVKNKVTTNTLKPITINTCEQKKSEFFVESVDSNKKNYKKSHYRYSKNSAKEFGNKSILNNVSPPSNVNPRIIKNKLSNKSKEGVLDDNNLVDSTRSQPQKLLPNYKNNSNNYRPKHESKPIVGIAPDSEIQNPNGIPLLSVNNQNKGQNNKKKYYKKPKKTSSPGSITGVSTSQANINK